MSPNNLNQNAAHQAGRDLLAWASNKPPGALRGVAKACGVHYRQVRRWIDGACEPSVSQALTIRKLAKVPVKAWVER